MTSISNLLQPPKLNFGSLQSPNTQYGSLGQQPTTPMAQSVTTGKPVAGSITGLLSAPKVASTKPVAPPVQPTTALPITPQTPQTPQTGSTGNAQNFQVTNPSGQTSYVSGTPDSVYEAMQSAGKTTQATATPTPQPVQSTYSSSNVPTYGGLVGTLAGAAQGNQAIADRATGITDKYAGLINPIIKGTIGQALGERSTGATSIGEGNARLTEAAGGAEIQGLTSQEQQELSGNTQGLTAQAQTQSGLNQAAGLAQPSLGGFNQQPFNPLTGQFSGGGGAGGTALASLPAQAQSAIQSYAQQIQTGQMTRADAESRLSAYGQPGLNALNEVLGTGFNTNASNASAATTAQGQQIQTAANSTNAALDTLGSAFANLSPLQTAGIPATNSIANWIGQQFGDQALTKFKTNLADARSQLIGVLNSSGGTPTGNEATALQYLPDNMTKAQFDTNVGTAQNPGIVRQLVAQKVGAFTQSGQQGGSTNQNANTTSNSLYNF